MRLESRKTVKNSVSRMAFIALSVCLQVIWMILIIVKINQYYAQISLFTTVLAVGMVLWIYGSEGNFSLKMPWIMAILAFPILGVTLYLLCGTTFGTSRTRKRFLKLQEETNRLLKQEEEVISDLRDKDLAVANQSSYIFKYGGYPIYKDTKAKFYPEAFMGYEELLESLKKAEKYIFMEYFAIEDAEAFSKVKDILSEKVKEGVEVRVIYDDIGSVGFIDPRFARELNSLGIQCRIFNQLIPFFNLFMNNRDHRKITVIDGKVAFTGGYNLANEYINLTHPYGYWKDTGVRIEGAAVDSFVKMYLEMWNAIEKTDPDYKIYFEEHKKIADEDTFIQPYADSPLDREHVGENVYMNIVKNAKKYVYFMTPYLIITDEMKKELGLAAKRGVDVRILTPGIPDKKVVYQITRSYYGSLVNAGVRIYEYTPGFCHAKECICDDEVATIGTINLDYRSLYLHFEDGVYMYNSSEIISMRKDYMKSLEESNEVTNEYRYNKKNRLSILQGFLRIFAPLL